MTTTSTPDTLPTLPSWQMGSSLRANDLNILSNWQRWLYEAADGLPASPLLRPAYRWDLSFSGVVRRFYGDLCLIHQHRYLVYKAWPPNDLDAPTGTKIRTVNKWLPDFVASVPAATEGWVTVDLTQYEWLLVGVPYYIVGARYAMESDSPYEF